VLLLYVYTSTWLHLRRTTEHIGLDRNKSFTDVIINCFSTLDRELRTKQGIPSLRLIPRFINLSTKDTIGPAL
jgi:hypothetical protein